MTFGDETLSYTWYEDGLKKTETWSGTVEGTINWDYDSNRKPEQITVGTEAPIEFGYDGFQRITSVGSLGFEYYETELTNLSADSGKLSLVTLDESDVNYDYDDKGLPYETTYSQSGVEKFKISYIERDDRDRIKEIAETENEVTTVRKYEYDKSGRLKEVFDADDNVVAIYNYDNNGNRLQRCTPEDGCIGYEYNGQDQLTKMDGAAYTYTLNGELKTKTTAAEGITTYNHDPMGNLVQVVLPNSHVIGYTYDAQNRRIAKKEDGIIKYRLIYSDQLAPAAKVDVDGNVLEEYVYALGVNSPDYIKKDGANYRVIKDHLGSTRMVVNASNGDVVKTIAYDEFGNVTSETGDFDIIFGYAGGIRDKDTGLTKFGARDYDAETGRWTSKEPLGFEGALNFYSYCDADPVNYVDVNGLFKFLKDKQLNTKYKDVKAEYLLLKKLLETKFKARLGSEKGIRYLVFKKLFTVSKENVNKIFLDDVGPTISISDHNSSGFYSNGTIYINRKSLMTWDKKNLGILRLVEHELAHYFDQIYNNDKVYEDFVSKVCKIYKRKNGEFVCNIHRYKKGTQMYNTYYDMYEAGMMYENKVYQ